MPDPRQKATSGSALILLPRRYGPRRARLPTTPARTARSLSIASLRTRTPTYGFNAATGEYVDLLKAGIIDPTKVSRTALLNAASVSGLALTTDVLLTELKDDNAVRDAVV